jgi:hypothetical protein
MPKGKHGGNHGGAGRGHGRKPDLPLVAQESLAHDYFASVQFWRDRYLQPPYRDSIIRELMRRWLVTHRQAIRYIDKFLPEIRRQHSSDKLGRDLTEET